MDMAPIIPAATEQGDQRISLQAAVMLKLAHGFIGTDEWARATARHTRDA
jgi:hypothetical protein